MKKIQILFFTLLVCLFAVDLYAQEQGKISGKVLSTLNIPVEGAVVSVTGSEDVTTDKNGVFQIDARVCGKPIFQFGLPDIIQCFKQWIIVRR